MIESDNKRKGKARRVNVITKGKQIREGIRRKRKVRIKERRKSK